MVSDQNAEDSEMTYSALPNIVKVKDSPIAGQGLFAKEDIPAMMYLGISHVLVEKDSPVKGGCTDLVIYRTPLGGFINHSDDPNCVKWLDEGIYYVKTIKDIKEGEELFLKYSFYKVG